MTLAAGVVTTIIACFPFVFAGLLDFVGIYGLLLTPVGAIVLTEHWIFPRLGLRRYWAAAKGMRLNHAALLSWALSIALALALERTGALHLFYLFLPVYAFAAGSYILLARAMGAALPRGSHESRVESHESQRPAAHDPGPATASPATWFSGAAAAAALGVCLWLAVGVAALERERIRRCAGELQVVAGRSDPGLLHRGNRFLHAPRRRAVAASSRTNANVAFEKIELRKIARALPTNLGEPRAVRLSGEFLHLEKHQQDRLLARIRIFVAGDPRADLGLDVQLLAQFPPHRFRRRLPVFDLAAGNSHLPP